MTDIRVPEIDIAPFLAGSESGKRAVAAAFANAFENIGFATIVGHGVPPDIFQAAYDETRAFFALDYAEKAEVMQPSVHKSHGYIPYGDQSVAQTMDGSNPPDLCEALVFGGIAWERRPCTNPVDLEFRRTDLWPRRPEGLRTAVTECY